MPRIKPPFPAAQGVYAAPTIVNNVETISTVPHIVERGAEWYNAMGANRSTGTRIFSVSGPRRTARQLRGRAGARPRSVTSSKASPAACAADASSKLLHPRRRVVAVAHARAPRRAARHGLRAGRAEVDARLRRGHGLRRDHRPAARRVAARRSSSRTSRAASARRAAKAPAGSRRCSTGWRTGRGARDDLDLLLVVRQQHRARTERPVRADDDLRARTEHHEPGREPRTAGSATRSSTACAPTRRRRAEEAVSLHDRQRRPDVAVAVGVSLHDPGRRRRPTPSRSRSTAARCRRRRGSC